GREASMGRWIATRGIRPQLTTKTCNPMRAGADRGLAPERIARQLRASVDRLGVDRVELYLAHDFDPDVPLADTFGAFARAQAEGSVGAYGVSNFDAAQLTAALAAGTPQAIQNSYSLLAREDSPGLLDLCAARGVAYGGVGAGAGGRPPGKAPRRRAVPGGVADAPAARAVPQVGHRPHFRHPGRAPGDRGRPRHLTGRPRAGLAARRRPGNPDRDRPRQAGTPGTGTGSTPASPQRRGAGRHRKGGRLMRVPVTRHGDGVPPPPPQPCAEPRAAVLAARARGETHMPLRSIMAPPGAAGFMGLMPSWRGGQPDHGAVFALKA